ncbi:MAG: glycosyltransferase family 4 protein [Nitrospinaceae bacterium]
MSRMRLFYFARIDLGIENAGSRHVLEFCRQFAAMGHSVTLFVPDLGKRKSAEGFSVIYVPVLFPKPALTFFTFYFSLFFHFLYYYFKIRPEIVYTRHQQMEWIVTWLRLIFSYVYVVEINGLSRVEWKIHSKPEWAFRVIYAMEWLVFHLADKLVSVSAPIRDILCEDYGLKRDRFLVASNGANAEVFRPMDPKECRKRLHLDEEGKYLVFIGSFQKWHGLHQVILAIPELTKNIPGIHLLIVGDGPERAAIENLISRYNVKDYVTLYGEKPFEELPFYINASDICLGTFTEKPGLRPLKIFDYMACGKPVVCNSVGGLDIFFNTYRAGVTLKSNDPRGWVDSIAELYNDPQRMRDYGKNGREAVLKEFNWEIICRKIAETLEAVHHSM